MDKENWFRQMPIPDVSLCILVSANHGDDLHISKFYSYRLGEVAFHFIAFVNLRYLQLYVQRKIDQRLPLIAYQLQRNLSCFWDFADLCPIRSYW